MKKIGAQKIVAVKAFTGCHRPMGLNSLRGLRFCLGIGVGILGSLCYEGGTLKLCLSDLANLTMACQVKFEFQVNK